MAVCFQEVVAGRETESRNMLLNQVDVHVPAWSSGIDKWGSSRALLRLGHHAATVMKTLRRRSIRKSSLMNSQVFAAAASA